MSRNNQKYLELHNGDVTPKGVSIVRDTWTTERLAIRKDLHQVRSSPRSSFVMAGFASTHGTETYWLPVEIKGVGVCFKQVKSGGMSSWFGGGGRDESSSEEEEESSSSEEEEMESPPPRAPPRRVPARKVTKKKKKNTKKKATTSSPSMLGSLFSAFGFTTDEQKGNGAVWECVYEDGVAWRRKCGDNSSKITSTRGPECGDLIKISVYQ